MNTIEVQLLGQRIALKSSSDPAVIQEVINLVSSKLNEVEGRMKKNSASHTVALLALLDIAEEYVQSKRRVVEYRDSVNEKSKQLNELIEAEFK